MFINVHNVLWLVKEGLPPGSLTPLSDAEKEIASYLTDILEQATTFGQTVVDTLHDLVVDGKEMTVREIFDPDADADEFRSDPKSPSTFHEIPFKRKEIIVAFWQKGDKRRTHPRKRSYGKKSVPKRGGKIGTKYKDFKTMQRKYPEISDRRQLYRWRNQVNAGGTHRMKLKAVSERTMQKFWDSKKRKVIVHDLDLRRWALAAARNLKLTNFKASPSWTLQFKKAHKLVTRKITKFVSKSDVQDRESIENSAVAFQLEASDVIKEQGADNVHNADQSSWSYEMHSGRTLEVQGERKVERLVQSKNATTHSFTIMPLITASGILKSPLYVVLQEGSGNQFGPKVQETLFRPPNLYLACSKSGKMGKVHLEQWVEDVFVPNTAAKDADLNDGDQDPDDPADDSLEQETVLVVDSWSTFTESNIREKLPPGKKVTILQIPAGTTGLVQPLDVYAFRPWKNYVRHIEDFFLLHDIDIPLSQRNNVLKLVALVHDQFRSPRYIPMFQYSWFKAGLITDRPETFVNPVVFGFRDSQILCDCCTELRMVRCSWCKQTLCINHFFVDVHMCHNFVP